MISGKVSCILPTYGRYTKLCEAVSCFLSQDYPNRELLIFNDHEVPIKFDHPLVTVINEPGYHTLGMIFNKLLDRSLGEFLQISTDDDMVLPWQISQCVENIKDGWAWKSAKSWYINAAAKPVKAELVGNNMEGSILWRTDFVRQKRYDEGYFEHESLPMGSVPTTDMGIWATWVFMWGVSFHLSGSLGNGQSVEDRIKTWRAHNQDHGDGKPVVPTRPDRWWNVIAEAIPEDKRAEWLKRAMA